LTQIPFGIVKRTIARNNGNILDKNFFIIISHPFFNDIFDRKDTLHSCNHHDVLYSGMVNRITKNTSIFPEINDRL
jgi:hypothetical protein